MVWTTVVVRGIVWVTVTEGLRTGALWPGCRAAPPSFSTARAVTPARRGIRPSASATIGRLRRLELPRASATTRDRSGIDAVDGPASDARADRACGTSAP